mmetsp:Transcript_35370/g.82703  ORF Transcript_35370/g.82703 Transcript_35370/m.82703 type:complete len:467 (+) Transcript_35370:148-1548(+)
MAADYRELACSKYPEDIRQGDHTAVFGSFYDAKSGKWGFACCKRVGRRSRCKPQLAQAAPPALPAPVAAEIGPLPQPGRGNTNDQLEKDGIPVVAALPPCDGSALQGSVNEREEDDDIDDDDDEQHLQDAAPEELPPEPGSEAAKARAAKAAEEVQRILNAPPTAPYSILGIADQQGVDAKTVRRAHRQLVLLLHPDKNPDYAERCKEALVRVQEARELLERRLQQGAPTDGSKGGTKRDSEQSSPFDAAAAAEEERKANSRAERPKRKKPGRVLETLLQSLAEHAAPQRRDSFPSPEKFIEHALLHSLSKWRSSHSALSSNAKRASPQVKNFDDTALAVAALCQMLEEQTLGSSQVQKLEQICTHLFNREYVAASQVYLDLSLGSKTWHSDVPTLMEGGMSWGGKEAGRERGQLYKQARTAQKLNSERKASGDDEALKVHLTSLKRLLNVMNSLEPSADPSKNCV